MTQETSQRETNRWMVPLAFAALSFVGIGLLGRLLSFPLNRDENLFVTTGYLLGHGDLYRDLGYNHLPNLPYVLNGIYRITGTSHALLTGRIVIFGFWVLAIWALWLVARRVGAGLSGFLASAFLLMGNVLLLREPGMLVSNNFVTIPFIFLAFHALLGALGSTERPFRHAFLAGLLASLTIGFKANFVFVAPLFAATTLLAPASQPLAQRLKTVTLPLALGGLVGGLPTLIHWVRDPGGFTAHTVRYFTELHRDYWAHSDEINVATFKGKILLAEESWFGGATLLTIVGIVILGGLLVASGRSRTLLRWPVLLLATLAAAGAAISFVPTPSFAQYFVPPIPFLILLFLVLAGQVDPEDRRFSRPILGALAVVAIATSASRIMPGVVQLVQPGTWDVVTIGHEMQRLGVSGGLKPKARIASFEPVKVIEGGYTILPEFAAGQFAYRVAPFMTADDRQYYRTTSPSELDAFLSANQPDGILASRSEPISNVLIRYARSHGYRPVTGVSDDAELLLFVRQR